MVYADGRLVLCVVVGLLVGSFLNVVIFRLPIMQESLWRAQAQAYLSGVAEEARSTLSLAWPASHCMHCKHRLAWWQNVPLLSFCILRGRCAYCAKAISKVYPCVELTTALCMLGVYACHGWTWLGVAWAVFVGYGVVISVMDWQHQIIPDVLSLGLLWWGLLASALGVTAVAPSDAIVAAAVAYGSLRTVAACYKLCRGRDGLGGGDSKLFAACGAWLGWQLLPWVLSLAAISGVVVALMQLCCGRMRHDQPIAFGPYLVLAAWVFMWCPEGACLGWVV